MPPLEPARPLPLGPPAPPPPPASVESEPPLAPENPVDPRPVQKPFPGVPVPVPAWPPKPPVPPDGVPPPRAPQAWPVVGFIFLPATTLAYELCKARLGGIDSPLCLTLLGLAFLHDLGHFGAFRRRRLKKAPAEERRAKFVDPE